MLYKSRKLTVNLFKMYVVKFSVYSVSFEKFEFDNFLKKLLCPCVARKEESGKDYMILNILKRI